MAKMLPWHPSGCLRPEPCLAGPGVLGKREPYAGAEAGA